MELSSASRDPTERFSTRVDDYVRYRPGYPAALVDHLRAHGWLSVHSVVADIGAGTGISSALFLDAGCSVHAVEPNAPMRAAAQRLLGRHERFHAVDGRAEHTTLADASVDLIAAGTAFHWFERIPTQAEFARILRPGGHIALFWNLRARTAGFMRDYEDILLAQCPGYAEADASRRADEHSVREFFGSGFVERAAFANAQRFAFEGLLGRVLSSSYAPQPGAAAHAPLRLALRDLFERCAVDGQVTLAYDTVLYVGEAA
ncbi:MAG TPA: class I SAM-dependent methyltransferase [Dokdonella sp.]